MALNSACAIGAIILALAMRQILRRANQKHDNNDSVAFESQDGARIQTAVLSDEERQSAKDRRAYVT